MPREREKSVRPHILACVLAGTLFLVGCGGETGLVVPAMATIQDMTGPWRPTPLLLDPAMRDRIATTCRRDMERKPTSAVAVIDARGLGVAVVRMTGDSAGACDALQLTDSGQVAGAGGGWRQDDPEVLGGLREAEIQDVQVGQVGGGDLRTEGWSVIGRAGGAIAQVVVETPGQPQILASLENGWFAAWWAAVIPDDPGRAMPPEVPYVVRGYDAAGTLVAEVSN
jgi:hypothetical protein